METIYLKTPLGITKIVGNKNGLSEVLFGFDETISTEISECLQNAVIQPTEYF
ncbi:MAG: methylated-DNA-[protein]-cysteine S-methyltransferase [Flavobacterium sp.]|jgi:methylated-DNA-[protein]-cysteine S-methyltransferase